MILDTGVAVSRGLPLSQRSMQSCENQSFYILYVILLVVSRYRQHEVVVSIAP